MYTYIYYYTPLPLNLANKQASSFMLERCPHTRMSASAAHIGSDDAERSVQHTQRIRERLWPLLWLELERFSAKISKGKKK